jgi:putative efflux protein, MATE family
MLKNTFSVFKDKSVMKLIFHLAWPTILEHALQTLVSYVDTAQVGAIGASASAAVGVTGSTNWLINAPMYAISIGVLSCISQAIGAKDEKLVRKAASQSVLIAVILGTLWGITALLLSPHIPVWLGASAEIQKDAFNYFAIICIPMPFRFAGIIFGAALRAAGDTKAPLFNNLIMNIVSVSLNFLLINPSSTHNIFGHSFTLWGAGLGVRGAAISTAIAFTIGGSLMFLSMRRNSHLKFKRLRYDQPVMTRCIRIGMPIVASRVSVCLGHVLFTSIITRLGITAIAAHSIAITAEQAFYIPGFGMQSAASTLAGYALGEKNVKKEKQYSFVVACISVGLMTLLAVFLFIFAAPIMAIFTRDTAVIQLGSSLLKIVALSEPLYAGSIVLEGIFNGVGYNKIPFVYSTFAMWGVRILFSYLCVFHWDMGLTAVWICMIGDNILRCILLGLHYLKSHWREKSGFLSLNMPEYD